MILLVNKFLLPKGFNGIALWPFVIVRHKELKYQSQFIHHEKIHLRQQVEMLILFFYLWYGFEYIVRLFQYKDRHIAYQNISFEREAYTNEYTPAYLNTRVFWGFLRYIVY